VTLSKIYIILLVLIILPRPMRLPHVEMRMLPESMREDLSGYQYWVSVLLYWFLL